MKLACSTRSHIFEANVEPVKMNRFQMSNNFKQCRYWKNYFPVKRYRFHDANSDCEQGR